MPTQQDSAGVDHAIDSRHWAMLGGISTACPLDCDFCYRKGNPPGLVMDSTPRRKTVEEVDLLCRRMKFEGFQPRFLEDVGEFFCNPHLLGVMRKFREYFPDELIDFTTSGLNLTRGNVEQLAELGMIFLQVSLNSANPDIRRRVMNDPKPQVAIEGVKLLREFGIPFAATIVGWPSIPEDDLRATVHYLDACDPVLIKINLPSYSRFFRGPTDFDTPAKWRSLVSLVDEMRHQIGTPLTVEPFMAVNDPITPLVTGVIRNSPAAAMGVRPDDVIREIDGVPILFREQARRMLIQKDEDDRRRRVRFQRGDDVFELDLWDRDEREDDRYPHKPPGHPREAKMFGMLVHQGLDVYGLKRLARIADEYRARRLLLLSSHFLAPVVRQLIEHLGSDLFPRTDVTVEAPRNHFFGGNVVMGDLLVVSDFVRCIEQYIPARGRPDLAVIPSSAFLLDGIDICGVDYRRITAATDVPVALLPTERVLV